MDVFETLPDGTLIWRATINGPEKTITTLPGLAGKNRNQPHGGAGFDTFRTFEVVLHLYPPKTASAWQRTPAARSRNTQVRVEM
jgi:hypothetical protein